MSVQLNLSLSDAHVIADPKYIVIDGDTATVYTGADIPQLNANLRILSSADFIRRFTSSEKAACLALAYENGGNVTAMNLLLSLQIESTINLDSPVLQAGMNFWVTSGCLSADRVAQILS